MKKIKVNQISVNDNKLKIDFSLSDDLKQFFKQTFMNIDYTINNQCLNHENIPKSILVIPFLCNVLPIVWLEDVTIELDSIDKAFYESIPEFKNGYIDMYPDASFKGKVIAKVIEDNSFVNEYDKKKSALFFSGGVDSYCTLVKHLDENPDLISVWGSDIPYDNKDGWDVLSKSLEIEANELKLPYIVVHSDFRKVIDEGLLGTKYFPVLHDYWWHGVQHGIALIGHAAPICYIRKNNFLYIAATFYDGIKTTCASDPTIDNFIKFSSAQVIHDSYIPRQDKIKEIVKARKNGVPINLHVCWQETSGENCCKCEKCCRTIIGIMVEGEDPNNYGFNIGKHILKKCKLLCKNNFEYNSIIQILWCDIKNNALKNKEIIKSAGYEEYLSWIYDFDFNNANNRVRIKYKKFKGLFKRALNKIKRKIV